MRLQRIIFLIFLWTLALAQGVAADEAGMQCAGKASVFSRHRHFVDIRIESITECSLAKPLLAGEIRRVFYRKETVADTVTRRYVAGSGQRLSTMPVGHGFDFVVSIKSSGGRVDEVWSIGGE